MSRLDDGGLDDWEEASLPGASSVTFAGQDGLTTKVIPKSHDINSFPEWTNERHPPRGPALQRPAGQVSETYRPQIQGMSGLPQSTGRAIPEPFISNVAYAKFQRGDLPNAQFQLPSTWRALLAHFQSSRGQSDRTLIARERLNEICSATKAYIQTPHDESTKIAIWCEDDQVAQVEARLQGLENDIRVTGSRPNEKLFSKMNAFNARQEARNAQQKQKREMNKALRALTQDIDYDFEAYLVVPDTIDLANFASKYQATILEEISDKNHCKIEVNSEKARFIRICGHQEHELIACYQRVRNLVKDCMAHTDELIVLNQFRLPTASTYRDRVQVDQDPESSLFVPTLHGKGLPTAESEEWNALRTGMQNRNHRNIRRAIAMCIKSMKAAEKYVRMVVTFGDLGFSRYRDPPPGEKTHPFDDFCEMVTDPLTRVRQYPLRASQGNLADLVDKLIESGAFREPTTSYGFHFDFRGPNQTTLRLETHFQLGYLGQELETTERRWLQYKDHEDNDVLEINMLDFENVNYQVHIGAADLHDSKMLDSKKLSFASNITFQAPGDGIKAIPKSRVAYPPGHSDLKRIAEITVARFTFRDTEGVFELRRQDVFDKTALEQAAIPVDSIWTAAYYYPEWDNLLRDFGSLKPGEDVLWKRSVATFFPPRKSTEDKGALPKGFGTFMREVEDIQELLTAALASLPAIDLGGY